MKQALAWAFCGMLTLIGAAAANTCGGPTVPVLVHFPRGSCPAEANIEVQVGAWGTECPELYCWFPAEHGIVPLDACAWFSNQYDLRDIRVRCVSEAGAGEWIVGFGASVPTIAECSTIIP